MCNRVSENGLLRAIHIFFNCHEKFTLLTAATARLVFENLADKSRRRRVFVTAEMYDT